MSSIKALKEKQKTFQKF